MKQNIISRALGAILMPIFRPLAVQLMRASVPWATYNYKGGIIGGTATGPTYNGMGFCVVEVQVDFAAIAAARVAAGSAAIGATDVLELVGVKAGTWVPMTALQVVTAEGAVATADIGDGATAAGFISNGDLNVVGWSSSLITTTYSLATAGGKLYTADDTIDMVVDSASVDVAVAHLFVPMVDLRKVRD
jgi:hypothetical protein